MPFGATNNQNTVETKERKQSQQTVLLLAFSRVFNQLILAYSRHIVPAYTLADKCTKSKDIFQIFKVNS